MRPRGLAEITAARADGRWQAAYASQREAQLPPELHAALSKRTRARRSFDALGKTKRYALIHRVLTARTPETRTARVKEIVRHLACG
jgi:uncharacterized protein YdeI (YjbR/CyaY-like superfamily)